MWSQVTKSSECVKRFFKHCFLSSEQGFLILLGDIGEGEIPDPIPNSEVKLFIADGTAHKSAGE
jgi:hypothetical protein